MTPTPKLALARVIRRQVRPLHEVASKKQAIPLHQLGVKNQTRPLHQVLIKKTSTTPAPAGRQKANTPPAPAGDQKTSATPAPPADQKTSSTPAPPADQKTSTTPGPTANQNTSLTPAPADQKTSTTPGPTANQNTSVTPAPADQKTSTGLFPVGDLNGRFKGSFSQVYAFGGSYTDTGNAHFLGGLAASFSGSASGNSPYGSTTFGKSSNRLCDGRLVLDFLCDALSLPSLPPYKSANANFSCGVNFAIAGSTALNIDSFTKIAHALLWKGTPMGIQTQIDWFNKFHQEVICKGQTADKCKAAMGDALFWIGEMGMNDYSRSLGSTFTLRSVAEMCVGHITGLLKTLLESGAKYIVVQGLPPVGCLPLDISLCPLRRLDKMGCSAIVNSAIMIHNQILQRSLEELQKQYPDTIYI